MNRSPYTSPSRLAPILLTAVIAGAIAWLSYRPRARSSSGSDIELTGNTMGGTWSVKLPRLPSSQTADSLTRTIQARLDYVERQTTTYRDESDLMRFNHGVQTDWQAVPIDLAAIVATALDLSEQTAGAFDVTVKPLVDLWGFGPKPAGVRTGHVPTDAEIAAARQHVDYHLLHARLSPPALKKDDPALTIDLSAIAKGYAAGQIAAGLDALGATDYLVAVGGELRARGQSSLARPWRAGVEVPTPDTHRVLCRVQLRDTALSTSGDYRNFADLAGHRYSHEIDPHTGRPVTGDLASVSVIHPDSDRADALATALMVLGPKAGYELAVRQNLAACFVLRADREFKTLITPEFDRAIVKD